MQRFRFALEGLERVRRQEVRGEEIRLAERLRAEQTVRSERERVRGILLGSDAERPERDVRALSIWETRRQWLRTEIVRLEAELSRAKCATREQRTRVQDAERKRQVVERIRERQRLDYVRETLREEQKELDEVGSRAGARKAA
jgi:flagellar biosynthesis chaperone FliJ